MSFKEDSDDLIDAQMTSGSDDLIISSANGRAVRFGEDIVRAMGTGAAGVRGIRLRAAADGSVDRVVSLTVANPADDLMVITAGGLGKRTPVGLGGPAPAVVASADADADSDEAPAVEPEEPEEAEEIVDENAPATTEVKDHYRRTNRGTQGVTSIKLVPGDQVVAAMQVEPDTTLDLLMLTMLGQAVRIPVAQVRRTGRNCKGVKVIRFSKEKDAIANVSLVDKLSEEDEAANAAKDAAEERSADRAAAFQEKLSAEQAALDAQAAEEERLRQEALENGDEPPMEK
jgi:DNA gyrase subunit A